MPTIDPDHVLADGEQRNPLIWITTVRGVDQHQVDTSDRALHEALGEGTARKLKSLGHDEDGVHYLITRGGTGLHTDTAYLRYSAQLVLRNDGNRIRGLPRYDQQAFWHTPMVPGVMYLLDTHSPHQGLPDPRMGEERRRGMVKVVIAVDRSEPIPPEDAWPLLRRYLTRQIQDFQVTARPPRWREEQRAG